MALRLPAPLLHFLQEDRDLLWLGYSILSMLFLAGLVVDYTYIWWVGMTGGSGSVLIVMNRFGEGWQEVLMFLSVLPWLIVKVVLAIRSAYRQTRTGERSGT